MKRPTLTRQPAGPELALVFRVFAVLSAVLLVGSVALAALLPPETTLYGAIFKLHPVSPEHMQSLVVSRFGHFVWMTLALPLLNRPVWMVPVCLGLICVGGAVTAMNQTAPHTRQRRS